MHISDKITYQLKALEKQSKRTKYCRKN